VKMALTEDQRADFEAYTSRYQTPMERVFRDISNRYLRGYRAVPRIIFDKYPEHIKRDKEALAGLYFITGYTLCLSGQVSQGRKYLLKSAMTSPLNVKPVLAALASLSGSTWIFSTLIKVYRQIKTGFHGVQV